MTKDEWKLCEEDATAFYGGERELMVDGYKIDLRLQRVSPYKNIIMIYVNGKFRGEWITKDCEERRRFMYRKDNPLMSRNQIQEFNKLPKSQQKRLKEYRDKVYTMTHKKDMLSMDILYGYKTLCPEMAGIILG